MATVGNSTCSCRICNNVRETICRIVKILEEYGWLLDSYIVDFYENDLWEKLPRSWVDFLDDTKLEELGSWILNESPRNHRVWPLSLLALRQAVKLLQIERDPSKKIVLKCESKSITERTMQHLKIPGETSRRDLAKDNWDHPKLRKFFTKHVKPKKKHEIDIMAQIIADSAEAANSECAADIGAGLGHLARTLAHKYSMCVTCVEQQSPLSEQARKLDAQLESTALKYLGNYGGQRPEHLSLKIDRDLSALSLFVERLNKEFTEKFRLNEKSSGFGLIGLHACGDLTTTLLRCYTESECAKFICIAGCCYMKMTLEDDSEALRSYPMSEYLRSSKMKNLSYAALEVACHGVEKHCQKLKSAEYWDLKIHAYRAALESLLAEKNPSQRHSQLNSIKLRETTTFKEYCIAVTENLGEENRPKFSEEFENSQIVKSLENWERVVIFGSLRFMLAPLVESFILLDRFLYLSEKNVSPQLKAVFDPLISPRNFLLTSVK